MALAFAYGAPKEAVKVKRLKVRNPSRGAIGFQGFGETLASIPSRRCGANWFLQEALACCPDVFSSGEAGFHELAAGLFMVGYGLTEA